MMMMPKEGMVCFIVFFDNENIGIWFGEKNQGSISIIEKVMIIFFDIMVAILNFLFEKNPLRMTVLHWPR